MAAKHVPGGRRYLSDEFATRIANRHPLDAYPAEFGVLRAAAARSFG